MKNHLIYTLSGMLFLLTSCDAFLNQEPLDQLAPDEYILFLQMVCFQPDR